MKCTSAEELKKILPQLREEFKKLEVLKSVYKYCFDFSKNKKDLDFLVAKGLWESLIKDRFPLMGKLLEFMDVKNG